MTRRSRPWSAEEAALVRDLDAHGATYRDIAHGIGRTPAAVHHWLAANVPGFLERQRLAIAAELHRDPHRANREIAAAVGCPLDAVGRVRNRAGTRHEHRPRHATPVEWLEQPPGRIKALRQAHGVSIR